MPVNLVSLPFELIIASIDRSGVMQNITLSQPVSSAQRDLPITGTVSLFVPVGSEDDYTYGLDQAVSANWAQGALITYRIANDSGTLVNHPLSGGKLYIMKEPSPPSIPKPPMVGILTLNIGDELAYRNQREPDSDVSGGETGVSIARNTLVERVLNAAGISSYSIPSLPYPFDYAVPKVGGSFVKMAGNLVGAANYVLHCNAAGTVIASPIDFNASAIATLTIGEDELEFEPLDGSNIPTVSELTVSGTAEEPDTGNFPLAQILEDKRTFWIEGAFTIGSPRSYSQAEIVVSRTTNLIISEAYETSKNESRTFIVAGSGIKSSPLFVSGFSVKKTFFVDQNLSKIINIKYGILFTFSQSGEAIENVLQSPYYEKQRKVEEFFYENGLLIKSVDSSYYTIYELGDSFVRLLPQTRKNTLYKDLGGGYFSEIQTEENDFSDYDDLASSSERQQIEIDGISYDTIVFPDQLPDLNYRQGIQSPKVANDGSTRPPATNRSIATRTKAKEVSGTANTIPLGGIPSKERFKPIVVDYLISNAHAYDYVALEILLMASRKQARFFVGALTDELLAIRPRCRIDVIYRSRLYRCLVDAITYSQSFNERTIGFACEVISSSPIANLSEVIAPSKITNSLKGAIQAQRAVTAGIGIVNFNIGAIQAQRAIAVGNGSVEVVVDGEFEAQRSSSIGSGTFT